jgi:hypothetical protein
MSREPGSVAPGRVIAAQALEIATRDMSGRQAGSHYVDPAGIEPWQRSLAMRSE